MNLLVTHIVTWYQCSLVDIDRRIHNFVVKGEFGNGVARRIKHQSATIVSDHPGAQDKLARVLTFVGSRQRES
jgi:hypothetical protein